MPEMPARGDEIGPPKQPQAVEPVSVVEEQARAPDAQAIPAQRHDGPRVVRGEGIDRPLEDDLRRRAQLIREAGLPAGFEVAKLSADARHVGLDDIDRYGGVRMNRAEEPKEIRLRAFAAQSFEYGEREHARRKG